VIDTSSNSVLTNFIVAGGAQVAGLALNDAGTRLYAATTFGLAVVDTGTTLTVGTLILPGDYHDGVALHPSLARAYVTGTPSSICTPARGVVSVVDISTDSPTEITSTNVGFVPAGVAVDPITKSVYVANNCGESSSCAQTLSYPANSTVSVLNPGTNLV